jgi:RimJ/RimL family protein N-acetyltransferase
MEGDMTTELTNALGQPIGAPVPSWEKRPLPPRTPIEGRTCRLEPLDPARHAEELFEAMGRDQDGRNWTYLAIGPFAAFGDFRAWLDKMAAGSDPLFHTVIDRATGRAVGVASYLRIDPANGVIEVGHIHFSPLLQRTPMATEAMFLMMRRVFDELGYRRYEWKCDSRNAPLRTSTPRAGSRRACRH